VAGWVAYGAAVFFLPGFWDLAPPAGKTPLPGKNKKQRKARG